MIKILLIILFVLLIDSSNSKSSDSYGCADVCGLDEYFNRLNGYDCYITPANQVICTCPDNVYSNNTRCRICDRENICGSPNALCSEESNLFVAPNSSSRFACFCPSDLIVYDRQCPTETTTTASSFSTEEPTTNSVTTVGDEESPTTQQETPKITVNTTAQTATTTATPSQCKSSAHADRLVKPSLIVLLSLVYFFNE